jgi:hypothetical protein
MFSTLEGRATLMPENPENPLPPPKQSRGFSLPPEAITFVAYLPDISGYWKPTQGGGARITIDVPDTDKVNSLRIIEMQGRVFRVYIVPE